MPRTGSTGRAKSVGRVKSVGRAKSVNRISVAGVGGGGGGGGGNLLSHEPSGMTIIRDYRMSERPVAPAQVIDDAGGAWLDDSGSGSTQTSAINEAGTPSRTGVSDENYVRMQFDSGTSIGAPATLLTDFSAPEQFKHVYAAWWMKHHTGWNNDPVNPTGGKVGVKACWFSIQGLGSTEFYCAHDNPPGDMFFLFQQQGTPERALDANIDLNASKVGGKIGSWVKYQVEIIVNNTAGVADGVLRFWIDDVLVGEHTNVDYGAAASRTVKTFRWSPTFGGGGDPTPVAQYQSVAHFYISGKSS